jgi:SAM-dependent methyltransferase
MHDSALLLGKRFFEVYAPRKARILDFGALIVNGSLRDVAPLDCEYVGLDVIAGPGVDVVVKLGEMPAFSLGSFDLVVSTSMLEHDAAFWRTLDIMAELVKPGGHLYVNAPSNGHYHAHPGDYWRFYPDAGLAFERLLRARGHHIELVESAVAERAQSEWNDFFCVLERAPFTEKRAELITTGGPLPYANIRRRGLEGFLNPQVYTEDQRALDYLARGSRQLLSCWLEVEEQVRNSALPGGSSWHSKLAELAAQTELFLGHFGMKETEMPEGRSMR